MSDSDSPPVISRRRPRSGNCVTMLVNYSGKELYEMSFGNIPFLGMKFVYNGKGYRTVMKCKKGWLVEVMIHKSDVIIITI